MDSPRKSGAEPPVTPAPVKGFRSVRGHAEAVELLRRSIAQDRVASVYLFVGPQGVGKERVALALAQAMNCAAYDRELPDADACGECLACKRIASLRFADLIVLQRRYKGDTEADDRLRFGRVEDIPEADLRQEIVVDQIEELIARMPFRPNEGGTRWVIVREAERMNTTVANKLLKTLEEPPQGTHFVLLTHRPSALLATVRSRCQVLRFGLLDDGDVRGVLGELGLEASALDRVAALADGSVGKALSFIDGDEHGRRRAFVDAMLASLRGRHVLVGSFSERADEAKAMDRGDLTASLSLLLRHFRDEACQSAADPRAGVVNAARADVVREVLDVVEGGAPLNAGLLVQSMLVRLREVRP